MTQRSESRSLDKVIVRLPDGMRDTLKAEAARNERSLNAEVVARLRVTLDPALDDLNAIGVRALAMRLEASAEAFHSLVQSLAVELALVGGRTFDEYQTVADALERYAADSKLSKSRAAQEILAGFLRAKGYLEK